MEPLKASPIDSFAAKRKYPDRVPLMPEGDQQSQFFARNLSVPRGVEPIANARALAGISRADRIRERKGHARPTFADCASLHGSVAWRAQHRNLQTLRLAVVALASWLGRYLMNIAVLRREICGRSGSPTERASSCMGHLPTPDGPSQTSLAPFVTALSPSSIRDGREDLLDSLRIDWLY
jgi:hypothetical protein